MKLTQLCLGSGLEGVRPAVSLRSGTACLGGSLSAHPCAEFSLGGACFFFPPPWSHDGLELEAQAESGGGTQSDAPISEVMCMFANYTPTTFALCLNCLALLESPESGYGMDLLFLSSLSAEPQCLSEMLLNKSRAVGENEQRLERQASCILTKSRLCLVPLTPPHATLQSTHNLH